MSNIIIGFSGKAGAGKDTAAEMLSVALRIQNQLVRSDSFAAPLKEACCKIFGWSDSVYTDRDVKEVVDKYWGFSPRTAAQLMGTEAMRAVFGNDLWIRALEHRLPPEYFTKPVFTIITDVRFQNEANWVLSNDGFLIHIDRFQGTLEGDAINHASEQGYTIDPPHPNFYNLTNNDSLTQLQTKIELLAGKILGQLSIQK